MVRRMQTDSSFGWRVVAGAFVLATFGWGLGFYGPPVYLHTVQEGRGWSVVLVSTAVTVHFLVGAVVVANLPALYRHFGLPAITKAGVVLLALLFFAVGCAPHTAHLKGPALMMPTEGLPAGSFEICDAQWCRVVAHD